MNDTVRLLLAILLLIFLLVVFLVSFILYRKTPAPKGCEDLGPEKEKCASCKEEHCHLNIYRNHEEETKK